MTALSDRDLSRIEVICYERLDVKLFPLFVFSTLLKMNNHAALPKITCAFGIAGLI